jgi:hypothetical protein
MVLDVTWYSVLLALAGLVTLSTPEWTRKRYVSACKKRGETPDRRPVWARREQVRGWAFIAAAVAVAIVRVALSGVMVDLIASLLVLAMIVWEIVVLFR